MTREEIKDLFMEGIDCSQIVAGEFAGELGMEEGTLRRMSACFGGGMHCGETCGAVTGALMVIGLKFGHSERGDQGQRNILLEKAGEFKRLYEEKYPSSMCRELLGHDISKAGEMDKVLEKGLLFKLCPHIVEDVMEMLKKVI